MEEGEKKNKTLADKARDLDEMERDLPSADAAVLERVIRRLRAGKSPVPKNAQRIDALHQKYFGEEDEDEKKSREPAAEDEEGQEEDCE